MGGGSLFWVGICSSEPCPHAHEDRPRRGSFRRTTAAHGQSRAALRAPKIIRPGAEPRVPQGDSRPDDFLRLPVRSAGRNSSLPAEYCGCDIPRQPAGKPGRRRRERSSYPTGAGGSFRSERGRVRPGCGPSTRARCQPCVTASARMVAALLHHWPRARCCRTLHSSTLGHSLKAAPGICTTQYKPPPPGSRQSIPLRHRSRSARSPWTRRRRFSIRARTSGMSSSGTYSRRWLPSPSRHRR